MNDSVLSVEKITKRFASVTVLNEVSLCVKRGEVHALVGENGAGKSTLMNIVSGVYQRDEGQIFLENQEVNFSSPRSSLYCRRGICPSRNVSLPSYECCRKYFYVEYPS